MSTTSHGGDDDESALLHKFTQSLGKLNMQPWMKEFEAKAKNGSSNHIMNNNNNNHEDTNGPSSNNRYFVKHNNSHQAAQRPRYQDFVARHRVPKRSPSSTSDESSRPAGLIRTSQHYARTPRSSYCSGSSSTLGQNRKSNYSSVESFRSAVQSPHPTSSSLSRERPVYTGWRSSECLVDKTKIYLMTPNERLASSLQSNVKQRSMSTDRLPRDGYPDGHRHRHPVEVGSELGRLREIPSYKIHDSIKSVTSAIIEYCGNESPSNAHVVAAERQRRHRSGGPRLVWMESSFVTSSSPAMKKETDSKVPLTPSASEK